MAKNRQIRSRKSRNPQILAMLFIGGGLIVLSLAALLILTNTEDTAASERNAAGGIPSAIPVAVEFPAPEIQLVDLKGSPVSLADFKGQVVLVNNWAIWCPPCKAEMPVLQDYYNENRQYDFTIIGIEAGEPPADVAAFVDEYQLSFPIWPDPQQQAMRAFQAFSLPNSYVLDRSGIVRLAWTGAISKEMLETYITPLLEE